MELYWGSGSPPCWKAMVALQEKEQAYKSHLLSFSTKDHKKPPVTDINERGQLPTFTDGDTVVNESNAIVLYLEKKYKGKGTKLIPDDPKLMGEVLQRYFEIDGNFSTKFGMPLIYKLVFQNPDKADELRKTDEVVKSYEAAKEELKRYDGYLKDSDYIVGKEFTLADIPLAVYLCYLKRFGCEFKKFPNIQKYYTSVSARPSVQATWPPHWKEKDSKVPKAILDTLDE